MPNARSVPDLGARQEATDAQARIDQLSYFAGFVLVRGSIARPDRVLRSIRFCASGRELHEFSVPRGVEPGQPCPFDLRLDTGLDAFEFRNPELLAFFDDASCARFGSLGVSEILSDRGHRLFPEFIERVRTMSSGNMLEIGSRARSGVSRRDVAPPSWQYVGLDIIEGPNVDVIGDAHAMSGLLPHDHFDAAMSLSVFEHLAMPWKVVLELNQVLKIGGFAFIQTHQTFPLHDEPWDFWRISADAWPALFNAKTGFRIIEAGMAEPLMFVARRWHPGVNLHESRGCAVSSVIVEKVAATMLSWDVDLDDVLRSRYPE